MFERIVTALEPFGLSIILLAGLTLMGRVPVADRVILGYATIAVGASLIVVHITKQMRITKPIKKKKD